MVDRNYRRYVQSKVKVYTDTKDKVLSYEELNTCMTTIRSIHILRTTMRSSLQRRNADFDINSDELSTDQFSPGNVHKLFMKQAKCEK